MRPILSGSVLLAALCLAACAADAGVGVPSRATSSVDLCMVATFDGSRRFRVVVRDDARIPVFGSAVVISLQQCETATFCTPPCTGCSHDPDLDLVRMVTDSAGIADFDLRATGVCPSSAVHVYVDGLLFASRALAGPDHDGDTTVTPADIAAIHARIGTVDPTADFNCSWLVDEADEAYARGFLGSRCGAPVPVRSRTWGQLKLRYR